MSNLFTIKKIFVFLLFLVFQTNFSQKKLIKNGDEWSYYDKGDLENDWYTKTNFSNWEKEKTPIGYGDSKVVHNISFGNNNEEKDIVKYFKKI